MSRAVAIEARARISELRAVGLAWSAVAHRLNTERVPTPTGRGRWHETTVRRHSDPERWAEYMRAYRAAGRGRPRRW